MRILFAGTPATALPSLDALLASRHTVAAVLTRPDAPAGRGRDVRRSPVALRADEVGLPVLAPQRPAGPEFLAGLDRLAVQCVAVVAYGALVPRTALDAVPHGWVNLHFSLLPAWRGAAPVQHALLAGDEVTGASTFRLEEALDTGPVFGVLTEPVGPRDTAGELLARLAQGGAGLLVATLDGIETGELVARPQPSDGVSYAPKLTSADVRVDWSAPAVRVDRLVRAATPSPGAWTTLRGRRVKLGPVTPQAAAEPPPAPGEIAAGGLVGTGAGAVRLGTVQPEGRPAMPAAEWLRGLRLQPGDSFA